MSRSIVASIALLLLAGCLGPLDADNTGAPIAAPAPGLSSLNLGGYLRNVSEPDTAVTVLNSVLRHVRIPAADGILLDAYVVHPRAEGKYPLVLEVTPYYGGGSPHTGHCPGLIPVTADRSISHCYTTWGDELVPRGYAVGVVSVRGTGNSEGCFTQGGPTEAKDTAAAIEYFAKQPWSNGNVGLMGVSYPGTTPQDVWVEAPPALKTIIPISGISDMYKYNFVNGIPLDIQGFGFNTYYWAIVGLGPAGLSGGVQGLDPASLPGALRGEACTDQVDVQEGGVSSTLDGNKDAYWQKRDFRAELLATPDKPRASVFYVHGLQDWNVQPHMMEDWLPSIQATGVPFKAWLGQWGHNWPGSYNCRDKGACRGDWWNTTMVAWFDQFLKGVDTGILNAPAVQVQADDRKWRHESAWPPTDAQELVLHPTSSGTLAAAPSAGTKSYYDYHALALPTARQLAAQPGVSRGPAEVVFVSEPMAEDLRIAGLPRFEGNVTASGARASLVLTLAERTGTGDRPFNYAGQSLNHVRSLASGDVDVSGKKQPVSVDFYPQDNVVRKGNRLVLLAAANTPNDQPRLQPISTGSTITLDLSSARLVLPVKPTSVVEDPQPYFQ